MSGIEVKYGDPKYGERGYGEESSPLAPAEPRVGALAELGGAPPMPVSYEDDDSQLLPVILENYLEKVGVM